MNTATLIVIEGQNCVGKETQTKLLVERLQKEGHNVRRISFPTYEDEHSCLVKMYLNGEFGNNDEVNPYIASTFYAANRYASYKKDWEDFSKKPGNIIIFDRYTTSNALFQSATLEGTEKDAFLEWVFDYEYNLYKLPKPTQVLYLNVPLELSCELMKIRVNKITGNEQKDIHEVDIEYLRKTSNNASYLIDKYSWTEITCSTNGKLKSIEEIHEMIYNSIKLQSA